MTISTKISVLLLVVLTLGFYLPSPAHAIPLKAEEGSELCRDLVELEQRDRSTAPATHASMKVTTDLNTPIVVEEAYGSRSFAVKGMGFHSQIGDQVPVGIFLTVCIEITNINASKHVAAQQYFIYPSNDESPVFIHPVATAVANGTDEHQALDEFWPNANRFPSTMIEEQDSGSFVLSYDVDPANENFYFGTWNKPHYASNDTIVLLPADEDAKVNAVHEHARLEPSETSLIPVGSQQSAPGATLPQIDGQVTEFGVSTVIHIGTPKWRVTFDQQVEVRYEIGGATPQNGQFLVIWFDQESQNGEPILLGSFELTVSAGSEGQPRNTSISHAGTEALLLSEVPWVGTRLQPGESYRTGIVFDIAPAETDFELKYDAGPENQIWGTRYPILIRFTA